MRNDVRSHAMGAERACAPGSMALLTRLAKQVYRRSTEELLGMHMRHLMALSYVRDPRGYVTRLRDPSDRRRHLVGLTPVGQKALDDAELKQESIEDDVLQA